MSALCGHPGPLAAAGAGSILVLGLAGSLHCLGMCGPLSFIMSEPSKGRVTRLLAYHLARLAAYGALGLAFWHLGEPLRARLDWPLLAFAMAVPLLLFALLPQSPSVPGLAGLHARAYRLIKGVPPMARAAGLGMLTPLLPCGLLYAAASSTLAAPAPGTAALWMACFAAGTYPLLLLGQLGAARLASLSPFARQFTQRLSAALAASVLIVFAALN